MIMSKTVKLLSKKKLYEGYLHLSKCDLELQSLASSESFILKEREIVSSRDSVHVLIYAPKADCFILGTEFRLGVFCNDNKDDPYILECVSGAIEKNSNPKATAYKEISEETGLTIDALELIASVYKSPGLMTEKTYIYYAEYRGALHEGIYGVKEDQEEILTHWFPRLEVYTLMDAMKIMDSATLIGLTWFRANKIF
jgi:ADP-ribose pyrophosphatase